MRGVFGITWEMFRPGDSYSACGKGPGAHADRNSHPNIWRPHLAMANVSFSQHDNLLYLGGCMVVDGIARQVRSHGLQFQTFTAYMDLALDGCLGDPRINQRNRNLQEQQYPGSGESYAQAMSRTIRFDRNELENRHTVEELRALQPVPRTYQNWEATRVQGYDFVITRNQYIGLVPRHAKPDDVIAVVLGCTVPLVLRLVSQELRVAQKPKVYQIIGPW
jgi:hypothetical protein